MMEFVEVTRQWARMCKAFRTLPNGCSGCPLVDEHCYHESPFALDFDRIEYVVMQWAADNPEPQYPTFREWLISIGVIDQMSTHSVIADVLAMTPIPADMAEKLGIAPKG